MKKNKNLLDGFGRRREKNKRAVFLWVGIKICEMGVVFIIFYQSWWLKQQSLKRVWVIEE
jgi:hypothetical protein